MPKPVYKKPTKESSPEDKEYVPVEKPLFYKKPGDTDPEDDKSYTDVKEPLYIKKKDEDIVNDKLAGDDKNLTKFKKIEKLVYFKKPSATSTPIPEQTKPEDKFKTYKIVSKPLYEKIVEDKDDKEKDDEEKRFQVVGRPLFIIKKKSKKQPKEEKKYLKMICLKLFQREFMLKIKMLMDYSMIWEEKKLLRNMNQLKNLYSLRMKKNQKKRIYKSY